MVDESGEEEYCWFDGDWYSEVGTFAGSTPRSSGTASRRVPIGLVLSIRSVREARTIW